MMNNVTALVKTFLRDPYLHRTVKSLKDLHPDIHVMVTDDGYVSDTKETKLRDMGVERYIHLPFASCGITKARNLMVDACETEYCLIGDDDFLYTQDSNLEFLLKLMEVADIAGGAVMEGGVIGHYEGLYRRTSEGVVFERIDRFYASKYSGIRYSPAHFVFNFFIAKTEALRRVRWDEQFYTTWEHEDFFLSAHKAGLKTVYCPDSVVVHRGLMADPLEYREVRHQDDAKVKHALLEKWGLREDQLLHEYPRIDEEDFELAEKGKLGKKKSSIGGVPETNVPDGLLVDNVQFTLTGPSVLAAGRAHELLFWVHVEQQIKAVLEKASAAHHLPISDISVKSEGPYPLRRGSRLSVGLKIKGLKCRDSHKWITWTGEIGSTTFVVEAPLGASKGAHAGSASIRLNGLEIARMSFVVSVGSQKHGIKEIPSQTTAHRSAFASYASQDRGAVLSRVQGMEAAYKGLDVFVDVIELRSGQKWEPALWERISKADVFYLFWCRHAMRSKWVSKEWRRALKTKGADFIYPIPLQPPKVAPPPKELAAKHFNDPLLAFISAEGAGHPKS